MAIKVDNNRKTFRSNQKSRGGGRFPGLEAYTQGNNLKDADITRTTLPILGRSVNSNASHDYDEVVTVYETSKYKDVDRIITITLDVSNTAQFLSGGATDFGKLYGQKFKINNPAWYTDPTLPQYYPFEFTANFGADPRDIITLNNQAGAADDRWTLPLELYQTRLFANADLTPKFLSYHPINRRLNANRAGSKRDELLKVWSTNQLMDKFGKFNNSSGNYGIPIALPKTSLVGAYINLANGTTYDNKQFGFAGGTDNIGFTKLKNVGLWYAMIIERSLEKVLPRDLFEILDPWDSYSFNPTSQYYRYYSLWNPIVQGQEKAVIKIRYKGPLPSNQSNIPNVSACTDMQLSSWDFTEKFRYVQKGLKKIERPRHQFHENDRAAFLSSTKKSSHNLLNEYHLLGRQPQVASNNNPHFAANTPLIKYDEVMSGSLATTSGVVHESELVQVKRFQKPQEIPNTYRTNHLFSEDIHYVDPNQQTWTALSNNFGVYTNTLENHITNLFNGIFVREALISNERIYSRPLDPKFQVIASNGAPSSGNNYSGTVDVFNRSHNLMTDTPPEILEQSANSVFTQYLEPNCVRTYAGYQI